MANNREMNLSFRDWRGNDITIGTNVIYPAEYEWHKSLVEAKVVRLVARVNSRGVVSYTVGVRPLRESADRRTSRYSGIVVIHHWWNLMAIPEETVEPASQPPAPVIASNNSYLRSPLANPFAAW